MMNALALFTAVGLGLGALTAAGAAGKEKQVEIKQEKDRVRVEVGGQPFTEYHYRGVDRPYFYPVIGPTGENVTRHWPMKEGRDEAHDHPHHQSLWFTHGDVNGHDFWHGRKGEKIVHETFLETGPDFIRTANTWLAGPGDVVCTDERTHRFGTDGTARIIDFEITIKASHGPVVFGDTKEGSMAIRLAPTLRVKGVVGRGHIVNSEGDRDGATWGKRAAWCDYHGPLAGKLVGVALFDHPANPRHPTWWHVRDYGLFAANPFGVHYFEKKAGGAGDLKIPEGESRTWRYRVYIHEGDAAAAGVAGKYRLYAEGKGK